jgi:preflagellin peptidase FlaK
VFDWLATVLTDSPPGDLLRLVAVPVFGWAAYRDVNTRRVPNRAWLPLAALGVALLLWDVWRFTGASPPGRELFFLRVALSLGLVGPIGYLFYWFGGFGGADAKALMVLAVLFPTFPTYFLPAESLPLTRTTVGVFSLTILSNTVLAGVTYPAVIAARNAVGGHLTRAMLVGRPVAAGRVVEEYGSLLETPEGFTRRGLDLDALRMYLQWRGCRLADLRSDPERYRDPDSLPARPHRPGDGSIGENPGGVAGSDSTVTDDRNVAASDDHGDAGTAPLDPRPDDEWGAEAFLEDIEGDAYGTTPGALRGGLEMLVSRDEVWMTPGTPFLVPMFVGLVVSLLYGDVLVTAISTLA